MRSYELVMVIRPNLEEEAYEAITAKFTDLIQNNGGELVKVDKWGKRRLAYDIKKFKEGYYVVVEFNAQSEVARELDRVLKITDDIIRHIVVRKDK